MSAGISGKATIPVTTSTTAPINVIDSQLTLDPTYYGLKRDESLDGRKGNTGFNISYMYDRPTMSWGLTGLAKEMPGVVVVHTTGHFTTYVVRSGTVVGKVKWQEQSYWFSSWFQSNAKHVIFDHEAYVDANGGIEQWHLDLLNNQYKNQKVITRGK